jgi:nucleoside-diphosphate kinase
MERTLVILKPDSVKRKLIGEIISRFEKKKFHNNPHENDDYR